MPLGILITSDPGHGPGDQPIVDDVRFGSLADIKEPQSHVRFTPRSRHAHRRHRCLLSAKSGLPGSLNSSLRSSSPADLPPCVHRSPRGLLLKTTHRRTGKRAMKNSRHSLTVGTIIVALVMLAGSTQAQQVPFPQTAAGVPGPAPGTAMTKAYVQMVGRMAYLWGW